MTAQKTAALRVELGRNPDVALAAVVHAMLLRVAYTGYVSEESALQVSLIYERVEGSIKSPEKCRALAEFESVQENYGNKIPGNPADLFEWCLAQSREELLLLAVCGSPLRQCGGEEIHRPPVWYRAGQPAWSCT